MIPARMKKIDISVSLDSSMYYVRFGIANSSMVVTSRRSRRRSRSSSVCTGSYHLTRTSSQRCRRIASTLTLVTTRSPRLVWLRRTLLVLPYLIRRIFLTPRHRPITTTVSQHLPPMAIQVPSKSTHFPIPTKRQRLQGSLSMRI